MILSGISFLLFTEVLIPFAHGGNITHLGKKKKERSIISKLPVPPGCLRFGSCGCVAQLCCSLAWGERQVQEPTSEAVWCVQPSSNLHDHFHVFGSSVRLNCKTPPSASSGCNDWLCLSGLCESLAILCRTRWCGYQCHLHILPSTTEVWTALI